MYTVGFWLGGPRVLGRTLLVPPGLGGWGGEWVGVGGQGSRAGPAWVPPVSPGLGGEIDQRPQITHGDFQKGNESVNV